MRQSCNVLFFVICLFLSGNIQAQKILSGPMKGYLAMRETSIWVQTDKQANVQIKYWPVNKPNSSTVTPGVSTDFEMGNVVTITLQNLELNTEYEFRVLLNKKEVKPTFTQKFKTRSLWAYRTDPYDLTFVTGSCAYINEEQYDRPGKPYGGQYQIFESMADRHPEFMLWLGDNTYLREPDWDSKSGIVHRYSHTRQTKEMQKLLTTTQNYAIWDDHDFGKNDSERSFYLKSITDQVFKAFWPAVNFGAGGTAGITTFFDWSDCEFYLMDDRTYRTPQGPDGEMLGEKQLLWLIESLRYSKARFKFVCIGSQVLTSVKAKENYPTFEKEHKALLDNLDKYNIKGVIFLTGDRHFSEVTKYTTADGDDFYDFTISPLTSGTETQKDDNIYAIKGSLIGVRNFAEIKVVGIKEERHVEVRFFDSDGKELSKYEVRN